MKDLRNILYLTIFASGIAFGFLGGWFHNWPMYFTGLGILWAQIIYTKIQNNKIEKQIKIQLKQLAKLNIDKEVK